MRADVLSPLRLTDLRQSLANPARGVPIGSLLLAIVALVVAYLPTAGTMVATWIHSDSFAHDMFVAPISLWLISRRHQQLRLLAFAPDWRALMAIAVAAGLWMVGHAAGIVALTEAALVAMLACSVWAVLGRAVANEIRFPLFFLLMMVPFGDFLLGPLMDATADFVVWALQVSGIPVYREGNHFSIPSGEWSVIEACAGLRYLIASATLGLLYSYLQYRSLWRRAAFMVVALVVPVLANWVRAYLIVLLAHLTDNRLATGIDHLIYGWLFFGLVMLLLYWIGSWFADEPLQEPKTPEATTSLRRPAGGQPLACVAAAILVAVIGSAGRLAAAVETPPAVRLPASLSLPAVEGITPETVTTAPFTGFVPHYENPALKLQGTYVLDGRAMDVFVGIYHRQGDQGAMITWENRLTAPDHQTAWIETGPIRSVAGNDAAGEAYGVTRGNWRVAVRRWFWVNGHVTDNEYVAKALGAANALIGRPDISVVLSVATPLSGADDHQAIQRLDRFATHLQGAMTPLLTALPESRT